MRLLESYTQKCVAITCFSPKCVILQICTFNTVNRLNLFSLLVLPSLFSIVIKKSLRISNQLCKPRAPQHRQECASILVVMVEKGDSSGGTKM